MEPIVTPPIDPGVTPTDDPVVDPDDPDNPDEPKQKKLKIRLSDGKVREIQTMSSTYFYVDGKPIGAEDFLKHLFEKVQLPSILGSEEELRKAWSNPLTRRDLLQSLKVLAALKMIFVSCKSVLKLRIVTCLMCLNMLPMQRLLSPVRPV